MTVVNFDAHQGIAYFDGTKKNTDVIDIDYGKLLCLNFVRTFCLELNGP